MDVVSALVVLVVCIVVCCGLCCPSHVGVGSEDVKVLPGTGAGVAIVLVQQMPQQNYQQQPPVVVQAVGQPLLTQFIYLFRGVIRLESIHILRCFVNISNQCKSQLLN
jgi:hypothetical protein